MAEITIEIPHGVVSADGSIDMAGHPGGQRFVITCDDSGTPLTISVAS